MESKEYQSKAITKIIRANSRVSVKIKETFYTFEFMEEREFPVDLIDSINFDKEKELLWDEVHYQVDKQVQDVMDILNQGK